MVRKGKATSREMVARANGKEQEAGLKGGGNGACKLGLAGWLARWLRGLLYVLPAALIFSYFPVIKIGANETMNFELSLTLIWLVLFDGVVLGLIWQRQLWRGMGRNWRWLLLPLFLSLSVLWSLNLVRGILTVGILWLLYLAGYGMYSLRDLYDGNFRRRFWRGFFGAFLGVCVWCVLQCVLDLAGVGRGITQMCAGCTYLMFGFPHPNGFAIEPQFMGNLLLAPAVVCGVGLIFDLKIVKERRNLVWLFMIFTASLCLTFSRGAIYAFGVAMVGAVVAWGVKRKLWRRGLLVLGLMAVAFLLTLNLQGIMAAVSRTDDTYWSGVSKVVNQLSLGIIKLDVGNKKHNGGSQKHDPEKCGENTLLNGSGENRDGEVEKLDACAEKDDEDSTNRDKEVARFDGYVAESTDTRMKLTKAALKIWASGDLRILLLGVGLGGAGQALYDYGLAPAPKEIVQNEYASLLLETGIIGVVLCVYTVYLILEALWKSDFREVLLTLVLAYGITLFFFSGLPNALQIYLMPMVLKEVDKLKDING